MPLNFDPLQSGLSAKRVRLLPRLPRHAAPRCPIWHDAHWRARVLPIRRVGGSACPPAVADRWVLRGLPLRRFCPSPRWGLRFAFDINLDFMAEERSHLVVMLH